jgi:hypothetical protein
MLPAIAILLYCGVSLFRKRAIKISAPVICFSIGQGWASKFYPLALVIVISLWMFQGIPPQ